MLQSDYYVIGRRLRESVKSQVLSPLKKGGVTPSTIAAVRVASARHLRAGMAKLAHVPRCEELSGYWAEVSVAFVEWWLDRVSAGSGIKSVLAIPLTAAALPQDCHLQGLLMQATVSAVIRVYVYLCVHS